MTTETVNAPEAKPVLGFDDPAMAAVKWTTNQCGDDLTALPHPLSDEEMELLSVDMVSVTENVEMFFGASGILDGTRMFIVTVEYHYRNDMSRHMWGSPENIETHITATMEEQTKLIKRHFCNVYPGLSRIGGTAAMHFREYMQTEESTDDRHILYMFLPIEECMKFKVSEFFVNYVKNLLGKHCHVICVTNNPIDIPESLKEKFQ